VKNPPHVRLERWTGEDFPLLVGLNTPEMTGHLGGPETPEQLDVRHKRYVAAAETDTSYIFKVILEPEDVPVGCVNFWDREWNGEPVYEMGWGVLPEHQGRGIASTAVAQALELARVTNRHAVVHAFPSVDNAASNGICRRIGFTLHGAVRFEYPKGHWMQCNDWSISLR
jgi:RimJ/RimL family protein N-acetyltransferase